MKLRVLSILLVAVVTLAGTTFGQDMTKDEWQQETDTLKKQAAELQAKLDGLNTQVKAQQNESMQLDAAVNKCMEELYALVGSNAGAAAAYRAEIEAAENKANDLLRQSDADLLARKSEVDGLSNTVKRLWENKLSLIPEFWDRLTSLNDKVKSLQNSLSGSGTMYTVGTWSRNRDCLWNISKKKDIYDNAWMWPKIWQGNRDQIKDPDIIHPGQKLRIPAKGEMTSEEKAAANSYYRKKIGS